MTPRGPDFFIVGAPKCGTTSLFRYLRQHPRVYMSRRKEPHFFCDELPPHFEPMGADEYFQLFADADPTHMAGEASTNYLYSPSACYRIREYSHTARIVVILRNPTDRAYSEYWHFRRYGLESLSFEECVAQDDRRDAWRRYVARGRYSRHVERYVDAFGEGAVHVLLLDDLRDGSGDAHADVLTFLGLTSTHAPDIATAHGTAWEPRWRWAGSAYGWLVGSQSWAAERARAVMPRWARRAARRGARRILTREGVPPMSTATRRALSEHYAPEVDRLERVLDRDLSGWRR